jgi:hypothetical protein
MLTATKRTLTAVAVIAAVSAPSVAYARFELNPPPATATSGQAQSSISPSALLNHPLTAYSTHPVRVVAGVPRCPLRGPCVSPASVQGKSAGVHSARTAVASSPQGFQWGDAAIGAAGMLVLLSAGGAAAIAGRRQPHRAAAAR